MARGDGRLLDLTRHLQTADWHHRLRTDQGLVGGESFDAMAAPIDWETR